MIARGHAIGSILSFLLVVALPYFSPEAVANPVAGDSEKVASLLSDLKSEAGQLKSDAEDLRSFTRSRHLNWQTHASKIKEIKEHVNVSGQLLAKLQDAKSFGSLSQQQAIDRVTPLMQELASNVSKTIEELSKHQNRVHMPPYTDYVAATASLATDLSALISDNVDLGKDKEMAEELGRKVEGPEN